MNSNLCTAPGNRVKWMLLFSTLVSLSQSVLALGVTDYVETASAPGSFTLFDGTSAAIAVDPNDWPGVLRAANDLAVDLQPVTGNRAEILRKLKSGGKPLVVVGTIVKSSFIERLARQGKIDVSQITGKWESFFLQVVVQKIVVNAGGVKPSYLGPPESFRN